MTDDAIERCLAQERELWDPACRSDPARVVELLAEDFAEIGASGRVFDRPGIVAALAAETGDAAVEATELTGRHVAEGLVLVTYRSRSAGRSARRSSLSRADGGSWRLVFHQGTPLAGP